MLRSAIVLTLILVVSGPNAAAARPTSAPSLLAFAPGGRGMPGAPLAFGLDAGTLDAQTQAGARPDYGTLWIGPWNLVYGWNVPDAELDRLVQSGVTPAIHLYYWGDDLSPHCLEEGCWSNQHHVFKDRDGWQTLTAQLTDHLNARLHGLPAVVFLETEFNKAPVARYEPLDGMLAEKADFLHAHYPLARVVLGFGNWGSQDWPTWDRAAAASDYVGLQGLRASTRDAPRAYERLYESTLEGARHLKELFHKPIMLQDIGLSSYPEPDYLTRQAQALQRFFDGLPQLKTAGVTALAYRSWKDTPTMSEDDYFGAAEAHWGLTYVFGNAKPATDVWVHGVTTERLFGLRTPVPIATTDSLASRMPGI